MATQQAPATNSSPTYSMASLYVRDLHPDVTEAILFEKFSTAGPVLSIRVCRDNATRLSLGYAYVNFQQPADAELAIEKVNGTVIAGKKVSVEKFQPRAQRPDRTQKNQGVNLYVKNLDETLDDESLKKHFEPFGNITSAKVMTDENGRSKGFGFVCFERSDEATNAVTEMNAKMVGSKPLYVAVAQRKEDRRAQLASQHVQRMANMGVQSNVPGGAQPSSNYVTHPIQQIGYAQEGMQGMQGTPSWVGQYGMQTPYGMQTGGGNMYQVLNAQAARPYVGPKNAPQPYQQQQQFNQQQQRPAHQGIVIGGQEPLTSHMLASVTPQEQKQLLGERIYTLIDKLYPGHTEAGKITGMMLELDNSKLLSMLQDVNLFRSKVDEAASVLRNAGSA